MRLLPLLTLSVLSLSACSGAKETLGLSKSSPDEFKVVKHAPLEMPSSYNLPEPRPGAPRPQEKEVTQQVKKALIGQSQTASQSQAEALLLQQAGTSAAPQNIRETIDREAGHTDSSTQAVAKRLLGIGGDAEDKQVLNAEEEAKRLKDLSNEK